MDFHDFSTNVRLLFSNRLSLISLYKASHELTGNIEVNNVITLNYLLEKHFVAHINGNKISLTVPENLIKSELNIFFDKLIKQF